MPYTDTEILAGVLVAACLLLLYCSYQKGSRDGMRAKPLTVADRSPGLRLRNGFYSDMPAVGKFGPRRSGYVGSPVRVLTMHSKYAEGLAAGKDLNSVEAVPVNPNKMVDPDSDRQSELNQIGWQVDALANADDQAKQDHEIIDSSLCRQSNAVKSVGAGSLTGAVLMMTDYKPNSGHMSSGNSITV